MYQTYGLYNHSVIWPRLVTGYQILDEERVLFESYKRVELETFANQPFASPDAGQRNNIGQQLELNSSVSKLLLLTNKGGVFSWEK